MIRIVSLRKAALAGVCGALAWTVVLGGLQFLGLPSFDIVKELGTLAFPPDQVVRWGAVGLAAHGFVGICWALVYAYFFWSRVSWSPVLQGLAFSIIPAMLALFIVNPQFQLMHLHAGAIPLTWETILPSVSLAQLGGLLLGHAIYGLTVGAIYTRPVGLWRRTRDAGATLAAQVGGQVASRTVGRPVADSCSQPESSAAIRRSSTAAGAVTRWPQRAIMRVGRMISSSLSTSASPIFATDRRFI